MRVGLFAARVVVFAVLALAWLAPPVLAADSVGTAIYCPFALTRSPYMFNVTAQRNGTYACISSDLYLNVTAPSNVSLQYTPSSCAAGVHQFNVTFAQNGLYKIQTVVTTFTHRQANCSVTYYSPAKRAVPDSHPLLILALGVAAALAVGFTSNRQRHKRHKPK